MLDKKVLIITITGGENYGNKLQNYAMQEILKKEFTNIETLNNVTNVGNIKHSYNNVSIKKKLTIRYVIKRIYLHFNYKYNIKNTGDGVFNMIKNIIFKNKIEKIISKRKQSFQLFCDHNIRFTNYKVDFLESKKISLNNYDYFVIGSDQVWNPNYLRTSSIDFAAFKRNGIAVALAASFGISEISTETANQIKPWIDRISYLSVREEAGKKILNQISNKEVDILCDPTMALDICEWKKIEKRPKKSIEKKYILTYFLGNKTREYTKFTKNLAKKNQCEIINLWDINSPNFYDIGPDEFLWLIDNSEYVLTDSFHAVVFSIIFKKKFIVFRRVEDGKSMNSRIETLLNKFNLYERMYDGKNWDDKEIVYDENILNFEKNKFLNAVKQIKNL